jgi:hypothetical protein
VVPPGAGELVEPRLAEWLLAATSFTDRSVARNSWTRRKKENAASAPWPIARGRTIDSN